MRRSAGEPCFKMRVSNALKLQAPYCSHHVCLKDVFLLQSNCNADLLTYLCLISVRFHSTEQNVTLEPASGYTSPSVYGRLNSTRTSSATLLVDYSLRSVREQFTIHPLMCSGFGVYLDLRVRTSPLPPPPPLFFFFYSKLSGNGLMFSIRSG